MSVELSYTRKDLSALAKELDIPASLLDRWRREYAGKQNNSFPGNGKVSLTAAEHKQNGLLWLATKYSIKEIEREVKKKFKVTTDSNHKFAVPENKLDRDFKPAP